MSASRTTTKNGTLLLTPGKTNNMFTFQSWKKPLSVVPEIREGEVFQGYSLLRINHSADTKHLKDLIKEFVTKRGARMYGLITISSERIRGHNVTFVFKNTDDRDFFSDTVDHIFEGRR